MNETKDRIRKAILDNMTGDYTGSRGGIDGAVKAIMQLDAICLAELADSKPEYRLAVVDAQIFYMADYAASSLASLLHRNGWYSVVKMEKQ